MAFVEENENGLVYLRSTVLPARNGFTTRYGGVSTGEWATLNLGSNRGDNPAAVRENYRRVAALFGAGIDDKAHGHGVFGIALKGGAKGAAGQRLRHIVFHVDHAHNGLFAVLNHCVDALQKFIGLGVEGDLRPDRLSGILQAQLVFDKVPAQRFVKLRGAMDRAVFLPNSGDMIVRGVEECLLCFSHKTVEGIIIRLNIHAAVDAHRARFLIAVHGIGHALPVELCGVRSPLLVHAIACLPDKPGASGLFRVDEGKCERFVPAEQSVKSVGLKDLVMKLDCGGLVRFFRRVRERGDGTHGQGYQNNQGKDKKFLHDGQTFLSF